LIDVGRGAVRWLARLMFRTRFATCCSVALTGHSSGFVAPTRVAERARPRRSGAVAVEVSCSRGL
jgi:hypothetical protein